MAWLWALHSAPFLLTENAVTDKVVAESKGEKFELVASNLSKENKDALMATFAAG